MTAIAESASTLEPQDALLASILSRSSTDMEFRRELLAEPGKAIAAHAGVDPSLAEENSVRFIEGSPGKITFVLPAPIVVSDELSDSSLEEVAGGVTPTVVAAATVKCATYLGLAALATTCLTWCVNKIKQ